MFETKSVKDLSGTLRPGHQAGADMAEAGRPTTLRLKPGTAAGGERNLPSSFRRHVIHPIFLRPTLCWEVPQGLVRNADETDTKSNVSPQRATVTDMDFSDALRAMKEGHRVSRASWKEPGKYIYRVPPHETTLPDGTTVEQSATYLFYRPAKGDHGLVEPYAPLPDALEGEDWYIVEEHP